LKQRSNEGTGVLTGKQAPTTAQSLREQLRLQQEKIKKLLEKPTYGSVPIDCLTGFKP
jgi:hypothetical protein